MLRDDALAEAITEDWATAGLDPRRAAMLRFTETLTRTPSRAERADVDALRAVGFADRDILHIVEVAAYYAYVNRVADGLGVELEAGRWPGTGYVTAP